MTDSSLPDYKNEPSEFGSARNAEYPRAVAMQIKTISLKIMQAHNLVALQRLRDDIQHSIIAGNMNARAEMKRLMNRRAMELKFKGKHGEQWWV